MRSSSVGASNRALPRGEPVRQPMRSRLGRPHEGGGPPRSDHLPADRPYSTTTRFSHDPAANDVLAAAAPLITASCSIGIADGYCC